MLHADWEAGRVELTAYLRLRVGRNHHHGWSPSPNGALHSRKQMLRSHHAYLRTGQSDRVRLRRTNKRRTGAEDRPPTLGALTGPPRCPRPPISAAPAFTHRDRWFPMLEDGFHHWTSVSCIQEGWPAELVPLLGCRNGGRAESSYMPCRCAGWRGATAAYPT